MSARGAEAGACGRTCDPARGAALVVAIMMLLLAGITATALGELGRLALTRARLDRDGVRAWFLAEAGLADGVVTIPAGTSFTALLGRPATRVDAGAGWSYTATVFDDRDDTPDDPATDRNQQVRLRVVATGPPPIRRRLEAVLGRAVLPFWPAVIALAGGVNDLTSAFAVDGRNYRMADACETRSAGGDRFGLGLPSRSPRPHTESGQISGAGVDPSVVELDVPALDGLAHAAGGTHYPRGTTTGTFGTAAAPALSIVDGDASVTGAVGGAGVLFVDGRLEIAGRVDFVGVVAARAGIMVTATGTLSVCGGVWAGSDPALTMRGGGRVRGSDEALAAAMRVAPLPAPARVVAVRELF